MRILLLAAAALLLTVPAASAHHWTYDQPSQVSYVGDSTCTPIAAACVLAYACTGGAPPQVVDLILYCLVRASTEAEDIVLWVPAYAWAWADSGAQLAETVPATVHDSAQGDVDGVNAILCTQVWTFFCSNPVVIPEHIPIADPIRAYPL